jgi:hypothetical protein
MAEESRSVVLAKSQFGISRESRNDKRKTKTRSEIPRFARNDNQGHRITTKGATLGDCHSEAALWPRNLALSGTVRTSGRDSSLRSE